jgi:hypothetical protein
MAARTDLGPGESPQVRSRAVALAMAGILGALVLIAFGLQLLFPKDIRGNVIVRHDFPAPQVISGEEAQRRALEEKQRAALAGADGRLPIEAAMVRIAAKGTHAFDPIGGGP